MKVSCKTPIKQGSAGSIVDSESSVNTSSKYKMRPAYSTIDTNSTRKKVYQNSHNVAGVVLVLVICILHGGDLFGSREVQQSPALLGGEVGSTEVCQSPS